jgi:cyclopropane-fatty-acyl-phospholipid synthase
VRLRDPALHWKLLLRPRLVVGEAYMDGALTIEEGTLYDLIDVLAANEEALPPGPVLRLAHIAGRALRRLYQYNPIFRARRNAAHHYDLSDQLYACFLDSDRQYSCAYFRSPDDDLDTAQLNKRRHLAAKLLLQPGHKVLDIGSGWGGLALFLARECGADVTGLTLSEEQHKVATQRAAEAGLADRVRFQLRDYREETGRYDRIVSVGMFEHVGVNQYTTFFRKLDECLVPDGVALLHSIGRMDGPGATNPWLRKYIFPGGYSPAVSEVVPHAERARLWITDIEILRLHYAATLRAWRRRFMENRDRIRQLYDERFCRMWEMYLVGSEIAFRRGGHLVMQIQMAKAIDTVPLIRDYISDWERAALAGRRVAAEPRLAAK